MLFFRDEYRSIYIHSRNYLTYEERPIVCRLFSPNENLRSPECICELIAVISCRKISRLSLAFLSVLHSSKKKRESLSYRLSKKDKEKIHPSRENFRERREGVTLMRPFSLEISVVSCIRLACLPKKIIAIKEGITSRQSIRSDSGFTRVKGDTRVIYIYIYNIYVCVCMYMYITRKTATWTKNKKGKKQGKKNRNPDRGDVQLSRDKEKKKKRKSIKRPRRTPDTTSSSSSSSERVPSIITVVRRLPFPYTQWILYRNVKALNANFVHGI